MISKEREDTLFAYHEQSMGGVTFMAKKCANEAATMVMINWKRNFPILVGMFLELLTASTNKALFRKQSIVVLAGHAIERR